MDNVNEQKGSPIMIAVVDDETMLLNVFSSLFKRGPYQAECFSLPTQVYDSIVKDPHKYQLLISDIRMPEMDGVQLARKVREVAPHLPIIFMSGHTSEEARAEASALGRVHFMDKPFSFEQVLKEIIPNFLRNCGVIA